MTRIRRAVLLALAALAALMARVGADKLSQTDIGLPTTGSIHAFGDFNSDLHTDLIAVSDDARSVHVSLWNHDRHTFESTSIAIVEDEPILNVVGADFNYDGKLDLLVSGYNSSQPDCTVACVWMHIYFGDTDSIDSSPFVVLPAADDQVLVMDANNDLRVDLFGSSNGTRQYWISAVSDSGALSFSVAKQSGPVGGDALRPLTVPHSHAFVDLNGDCVADLFVTSTDAATGARHFEFWRNTQPAEGTGTAFVLDKTFAARAGAGAVTFADFDADGTLDLAFPVCAPAGTCATENTVHVFFNNQLPMCASVYAGGSGCRRQDRLCTADPDYWFDAAMDGATATSASHVVVPAAAFGTAGGSTAATTFVPNPGPPNGAVAPPPPHLRTQPIVVRAGDIDLDGYPDLLIPVQTAGVPRLTLWINTACSTELGCSDDAIGASRRTFVRDTDVASLEAVAGVYAGAFFDVNDQGALGVFALHSGGGGGGGNATAFANDYHTDAYFLTTVGSNGVCPAWCPSGAKFPSPKPYGVNYPGMTVKFTVTSLGGTKRPRQGAQLAQSAYRSLQTPYNLFGLGRTNNYIEQFYVGYPLSGSASQMWVTIIPNSQLVVFPYPPSDPAAWTLELFIAPSSRLLWVGVALACTCALLVAIIGVFHWRERQQDARDQKQTEHLFAF